MQMDYFKRYLEEKESEIRELKEQIEMQRISEIR
jgi:hypothetical protein